MESKNALEVRFLSRNSLHCLRSVEQQNYQVAFLEDNWIGCHLGIQEPILSAERLIAVIAKMSWTCCYCFLHKLGKEYIFLAQLVDYAYLSGRGLGISVSHTERYARFIPNCLVAKYVPSFLLTTVEADKCRTIVVMMEAN